MSHPDNGQFFKNCTFNSFLRLLGPQIVPPTAPDWFESISRVQCKSRIKSWDDDVTTWSLKDHVVTLCLRTISVRLKSECIQKLIKHLYFVHLFRYPAKKKRENVKKYNFLQMISGCDICNLSGLPELINEPITGNLAHILPSMFQDRSSGCHPPSDISSSPTVTQALD